MANATNGSGCLSVLHLDAGQAWAGGQNQVRQLMRRLAAAGVDQLCLCPQGSPLEQRLRQEGLPVEGIRWRGVGGLRTVSAVWRRMRGRDIVHCHDAHSLQVALIPARLRGVRIVAARRVHFPTRRLKWNRADRVVAISETVAAALAASGISPEKVVLIRSGVDVEEISGLPPLAPSLRERLGIGPDEFLAGNIGHLYPYKGQSVIPEAAKLVAGVRWVIIGEGPERGRLEAAVRDGALADRVQLTGYVPDARRALPELDLFVFTSTNEPLGTSVLDAMARGVPVVGADAAGSAEILGPVHAVTRASLYPAGDARALAALVERLRGSPGLRRRLVEEQFRRLEDFRIEKTVEGTLALYRELVGEA